jgi:tRNA nucleotidyltransferase (CCA-adding enzyme)
MKIYLVGGAVRDHLLGRSVKDRDWVVVGATPKQLIAKGFKPVGKDFPVFLHPTTHEEYALARTEKKTGTGYKGFTFYYSPDVTLEQDLARRDLTINAIAEDQDGSLIDPFDGQKDIQQKILRHVSPAFQEDPVRVLRVARFTSSLPTFSIHADTMQLMKSIVNEGEIDALVAERVWNELIKAMHNHAPENFFNTLVECGAQQKLWPMITPQHIETLTKTSKKTTNPLFRLALLLHDSPKKYVAQFIKHYKAPNHYSRFILLVNEKHPSYLNLNLQDAKNILDLFQKTDALRQTDRFIQFCEACHILSNKDHDRTATRLIACLKTIKKIDTAPLVKQNLHGLAFKNELEKEQLKLIEKTLK